MPTDVEKSATRASSRRGQRRAAPLPTHVHVTLPADPDAIFVVPRADVAHVPAAQLRTAQADGTALVACPAFVSEGGCDAPAGACTHAHVAFSPGAAPQLRQHRAPAGGWPSLGAVPYECFPAGAAVGIPDPVAMRRASEPPELEVQAPNVPGRVLETLRPEECLRTRALEDHAGAKLTHCGHWLVKGACHFGAACKFVHAARPSAEAMASVASRRKPSEATVDEKAGHDTALPACRDRATDTHLPSRSTASLPCLASGLASLSVRPLSTQHIPTPEALRTGRELPSGTGGLPGVPMLPPPMAATRAAVGTTAGAGSHAGVRARAFRHDPYSAKPVSVGGVRK
eukprot:CAMPEP_0174839488 /NCGR_PEP_ID=MMETSP1114-20130205/8069_1 /TAXON_ID=312471 /ORGANISM="Neobodo designis, Strain CCAP 1951/1" /LENGTH=342 /DNA_ID=CAMNT_0016073609 /DNA_START=99 /DNA_END=1127 /DNA_ORIENTATION=-